MKILVALGGNALLERGEKPDASIQREHVRVAAQALAPDTHVHCVVNGIGSTEFTTHRLS